MSIFTKETKSEFDKLIAEGLNASRELERLRGPAKLSAGAFLRRSMQIADCNEDDLNRLEDRIEKGVGYDKLRYFLQKVVQYIQSPECSQPSVRSYAYNFIMRNEYDNVCQLLAGIGGNMFALQAIAVRKAVKEHPESFGEVEDMDAFMRSLKECESKLQDLYHKIEVSWTSEDVDIQFSGTADLFFIRFKGTPVSVGTKGCGESLVNHLRASG